MAMNPSVGMASMSPMGGPVGSAPVPMMNNGAMNMNPQAVAGGARPQQAANENQRGFLNTYIYEYFLRYGMYEPARALLNSDQQVNVHKDGAGRRRDENGNVINGVGDDAMETDSKDDLDGKLPDDLPPPKLPMPTSDTSFLYEWFCLFWDIYNAQRAKVGNNGSINQYVSHTQSRMRQQQHEMFRQMRPDLAQQQYQAQMMRMQNGMMNQKQGNLARTAMANNQNNPQMMAAQQQQQQQPQAAKQMQRDPSGMDQNRERPPSPTSGDNAPSPSKRQRIEGGAAPFNPNQPGMMPNGRGQVPAATPAQQQQAQQLLQASGINPHSLNPQQFNAFVTAGPQAQQKSIQTYSQNLQQHHGNQMGGKQMPNVAVVPQGQGSPMMPPGPDGANLNAFYNPGDMAGAGAMRPGPNGAQGAGGSNHALQDYQMQLMLLEQQNKKRLMMARQEQDNLGGMPRDGPGPSPGAPGVPGQNGPFPETSPQAMRTGTSPNPADQMKRGTPQMNSSGIPSPGQEGGQSQNSPMNFVGGDPNMAPQFNLAAAQAAQMNGMRPPSSHPGQQFNGQMTPQQMMAARQGQPQQGNPQQWQQGANGQMAPQGMPNPPAQQGTPQQRAMPPPSAPAAATNGKATASPQQAAAAPPTPNQSTKAAPKKKKETAKEKRAASKKSNQNLNAAAAAAATPASDTAGNGDSQAPATPITPVNQANFNKNNQAVAGGQTTASTAAAVPAPAPAPAQDLPQDPMTIDPGFGSMMNFTDIELGNPMHTTDVLNDFDFDSFLHDGDGDNQPFDFNAGTFSAEGGEIGAE